MSNNCCYNNQQTSCYGLGGDNSYNCDFDCQSGIGGYPEWPGVTCHAGLCPPPPPPPIPPCFQSQTPSWPGDCGFQPRDCQCCDPVCCPSMGGGTGGGMGGGMGGYTQYPQYPQTPSYPGMGYPPSTYYPYYPWCPPYNNGGASSKPNGSQLACCLKKCLCGSGSGNGSGSGSGYGTGYGYGYGQMYCNPCCGKGLLGQTPGTVSCFLPLDVGLDCPPTP